MCAVLEVLGSVERKNALSKWPIDVLLSAARPGVPLPETFPKTALCPVLLPQLPHTRPHQPLPCPGPTAWMWAPGSDPCSSLPLCILSMF